MSVYWNAHHSAVLGNAQDAFGNFNWPPISSRAAVPIDFARLAVNARDVWCTKTPTLCCWDAYYIYLHIVFIYNIAKKRESQNYRIISFVFFSFTNSIFTHATKSLFQSVTINFGVLYYYRRIVHSLRDGISNKKKKTTRGWILAINVFFFYRSEILIALGEWTFFLLKSLFFF